jgi:hypothetical protein
MTRPISILNDMIHKAECEKYPMIRPELLRCNSIKASKANDLTKAVIKYIQLMGGQAERISVTGRRIDQRRVVTDCMGGQREIGAVKWIKSSMQKGSADISAVIHGRSVKIEIKVGRDRQSGAQKIYQDQVERAGGTYLIVGTFDEFYEWYNSQVW